MGYTTRFTGEFALDKALSNDQRLYLKKFSETRRLKRYPELVRDLPDPLREKVSLPVGEDGGYCVADVGHVVDRNTPPGQLAMDYRVSSFQEIWKANQSMIKTGSCQPGLWCQWIPNDDGTAIEWDGGEKFYYYVEWIKYLIDHFLGPWGILVNGTVTWKGERDKDEGRIEIINSKVKTIELDEENGNDDQVENEKEGEDNKESEPKKIKLDEELGNDQQVENQK